MNETVKAALLAERDRARSRFAAAERAFEQCSTVAMNANDALNRAHSHLRDVEMFLRDNGVDLAAVDAEAEKARPKPSALQQALAGSYGQPLTSLNVIQHANVMAGLAKALDEA
jgi:hypothetical protein